MEALSGGIKSQPCSLITHGLRSYTELNQTFMHFTGPSINNSRRISESKNSPEVFQRCVPQHLVSSLMISIRPTNIGYMNTYTEAIVILLKCKTDWLLLSCSESKVKVFSMPFKAFHGLTVSFHIHLTCSRLSCASHSSPAAPSY